LPRGQGTPADGANRTRRLQLLTPSPPGPRRHSLHDARSRLLPRLLSSRLPPIPAALRCPFHSPFFIAGGPSREQTVTARINASSWRDHLHAVLSRMRNTSGDLGHLVGLRRWCTRGPGCCLGHPVRAALTLTVQARDGVIKPLDHGNPLPMSVFDFHRVLDAQHLLLILYSSWPSASRGSGRRRRSALPSPVNTFSPDPFQSRNRRRLATIFWRIW